MNFIVPHGVRKAESELLTNPQFKSLLLRAAAARASTRGAGRWRAYETLKRQLDCICGWSSRDPAMTPEHYQAGLRMLTKALEV
jgi:hypothetical protein